VEVDVPLDSNLAHIYHKIEEIGQQLKADDPDALEPTLVDGVESLGESHLLLRTLTKVKPGKHIHIQRVLRKLYMDNFLHDQILIAAVAEGSKD
jgi:small-conductance mechanosensitive channel